MNIIQKFSPNQDSNRKPLKSIVIHNFGDSLTTNTGLPGADATFRKTGGTSAHYGVELDQVWQWVADNKVAYHAGVYTVNQETIGIEMSGGLNRPIHPTTFSKTAELIRLLRSRHGNLPLRTHRSIKATACPSAMVDADLARLDALARQGEDNNMKFQLYREKPTGKIYFKVWENRLVHVPSPAELTFYFGEAPTYQEVDSIHAIGIPVEEVFNERDTLRAGVTALQEEVTQLKERIRILESIEPLPPVETVKIEIKEVPVPETSLSIGRLFELIIQKLFTRSK